MHRVRGPVLIRLALLTGSIAVGNDLGSCVDVGCPLQSGTKTAASCHISNETLNAIGVTIYIVPLPVPDPIVANNNSSERVDNIWAGALNATLAWTVGVSNWHHAVDGADSHVRHIDRIYYIGVPPSLNLTSDSLPYGGCALYMTGEDNKSVFYDAAANQHTKHSYCRTLMGYTCHDALKASAQSFAQSLATDPIDNTNSSVRTSCIAMAAHLQSTLSRSCPSFASTTTITGVPLTGPQAESPFTSSQNAMSDCYPTLPKSNDLTRAFSYNVTSLVYNSETYPALLGETPLWSVFYPLSNATVIGLVEPDVQLLCLRPVDENMNRAVVDADATSSEIIAVGAGMRRVGLRRWTLGMLGVVGFLLGNGLC